MLPALPLDLHVLGLPLAFILSQDQTLRCIEDPVLSQESSCFISNLSYLLGSGSRRHRAPAPRPLVLFLSALLFLLFTTPKNARGSPRAVSPARPAAAGSAPIPSQACLPFFFRRRVQRYAVPPRPPNFFGVFLRFFFPASPPVHRAATPPGGAAKVGVSVGLSKRNLKKNFRPPAAPSNHLKATGRTAVLPALPPFPSVRVPLRKRVQRYASRPFPPNILPLFLC